MEFEVPTLAGAEAVASRIAAAAEAPPPTEAPDPSSGMLPPGRAMRLCDELFRDHPGALIRERCRDEMFAKDEEESVRDLVYGEFGFLSLVAFFKKHRTSIPRAGATCYDLGSGVGRPVFAAATLHPFAKVVGMECLEGLNALGAELARLYAAEVAPRVTAAMRAHADADAGTSAAAPPPTAKAPAVELVRCDFMADDRWGEADVVLVNSCCFSEDLFAGIEARASELLRPGALVVTLRQRFASVEARASSEAATGVDGGDVETGGACWELLEASERRMSWGPSMMFVYRRTAAPPPPR